MDKDVIQKMYDSFPDEEVFDPDKEVDTFLVGDGSAHLMKGVQTRNYNSSQQLTGVNSLGDLYRKPDESQVEVQDDLHEFAQEEVPIKVEPDVYLFSKKKAYLDQFGFLAEKSKQFAGRPIRERDLVLNEEDGYLLHYMESHDNISRQRLSALAQLSACKDMGFQDVKFYQVDDCPMCRAYHGTVHKVADLISRFGSGQDFIHEGCFCEFIPIIADREQFKDIQNGLTLSAYIEEVYFECLPLEFVDFMTPEVVKAIPYKRVVFRNFDHLEEKDVKRYKVTERDVVIDLGESLWVRNTYILHASPLDFLMAWLNDLNTKTEDLAPTPSDSEDVFYLNGRKVVEKSGNYVDVETGEIVSLLGGE